jgi:hypothetical protein
MVRLRCLDGHNVTRIGELKYLVCDNAMSGPCEAEEKY